MPSQSPFRNTEMKSHRHYSPARTCMHTKLGHSFFPSSPNKTLNQPGYKYESTVHPYNLSIVSCWDICMLAQYFFPSNVEIASIWNFLSNCEWLCPLYRKSCFLEGSTCMVCSHATMAPFCSVLKSVSYYVNMTLLWTVGLWFMGDVGNSWIS
jgi:hypothetical protein